MQARPDYTPSPNRHVKLFLKWQNELGAMIQGMAIGIPVAEAANIA